MAYEQQRRHRKEAVKGQGAAHAEGAILEPVAERVPEQMPEDTHVHGIVSWEKNLLIRKASGMPESGENGGSGEVRRRLTALLNSRRGWADISFWGNCA